LAKERFGRRRIEGQAAGLPPFPKLAAMSLGLPLRITRQPFLLKFRFLTRVILPEGNRGARKACELPFPPISPLTPRLALPPLRHDLGALRDDFDHLASLWVNLFDGGGRTMRALFSFDRLFKRFVSFLPILGVALPSPSAFENVAPIVSLGRWYKAPVIRISKKS